MSDFGIHHGYLKKYSGLLFKQWKERFIFLSLDGSLLICQNAGSLPDLEISLQGSCKAILEGKDITNLPRLPLGAQTDCCLSLVLNDGKLVLLLAPNSQECSQWLNILRKVKEGSSHGSASIPCVNHINSKYAISCCQKDGSPSVKKHCHSEARFSQSKLKISPSCLRHGAQACKGVKAACLLVGGAAAGPTLGCMVPSSTALRPGEAHPPDFKELGYHPSAYRQDVECSQYDNFDSEAMDQDIDAFDFGSFAF